MLRNARGVGCVTHRCVALQGGGGGGGGGGGVGIMCHVTPAFILPDNVIQKRYITSFPIEAPHARWREPAPR